MQKPGDHVTSRPLGVIIIGRKRAGFDQEWSQAVCERGIAALRSLGYECVGGDVKVVEDESLLLGLDKIRQAQCQALLLLQPSIGEGQLAFTVLQHWVDPVILWATPEKPGDGKVSSNSLVGQHLWASILRQAGRSFEFVYGDPDDSAVRSDLVRAIALSRTASGMRRCKVGLVGTHAPGFVDLAVNPFHLRRLIGVQLQTFSAPQFFERVRGIPETDVRKDVLRVLDLGLPLNDITSDDLATNSRFYIAMLDLMREENLDGLALQCWPDIPRMLGQWPYLAVSRLSSEGYAVAVEGDVDGCIGNLMNEMLGLGPCFLTDWLEHDDKSVFFWHPGMAPYSMCSTIGSANGPVISKHFNLARPCVIDGQIRSAEPVTITRLWGCDNRYHITAFEGRTITPRRAVTANSVLVETTEPALLARFDELLHAGMPHHVHVSFGKHAETFRRLARMLNLVWHP